MLGNRHFVNGYEVNLVQREYCGFLLDELKSSLELLFLIRTCSWLGALAESPITQVLDTCRQENAPKGVCLDESEGFWRHNPTHL